MAIIKVIHFEFFKDDLKGREKTLVESLHVYDVEHRRRFQLQKERQEKEVEGNLEKTERSVLTWRSGCLKTFACPINKKFGFTFNKAFVYEHGHAVSIEQAFPEANEREKAITTIEQEIKEIKELLQHSWETEICGWLYQLSAKPRTIAGLLLLKKLGVSVS